MERQVIGNLATPFLHRGEGVMVGMSYARLHTVGHCEWLLYRRADRQATKTLT